MFTSSMVRAFDFLSMGSKFTMMFLINALKTSFAMLRNTACRYCTYAATDWITLNNLIVCGVALVLALVIVETIKYPRIIINPIVVPSELKKKGFAPIVVAHLLGDAIQSSLGTFVGPFSDRRVRVNTIAHKVGSHGPDIVIPIAGKTIKSIAEYAAIDLSPHWLRPRIIVRGYLLYSDMDKCLSLHLRIGHKKGVTTSKICEIEKFPQLLKEGADYIIKGEFRTFRKIDPCGLASFYFQKYRNQSTSSEAYRPKVEELTTFLSTNYAENSFQATCAATIRGMVHLLDGEHDKAIAELERAIALDPGDHIRHNNLAHAYSDKKDYEKARLYYN